MTPNPFAQVLHDFGSMPPAANGFSGTFTWSGKEGETSTVSVEQCATLQDVRERLRRMALEFGYTPPRWWQWWRWKESPLP